MSEPPTPVPAMRIPLRRRLAVRLSLVVVLQISAISYVVFTVWGLVPYWPFLQSQRERFVEQMMTPATALGREALRILDDPYLTNAQRRERLAPLLETRLGDPQAGAELLIDVQRARSYFSPLFVLAWVVFPTLVLALWLTWRVVRPVAAVAAAADRVTRGDLGVRVPLSKRLEKTQDELTLLIRRFNTMAETLARLEHERKAMIADIAHELRTPLAILQGQLDALADGIFPLTKDEIVPLAQETELLSRLVDDLRTLSLAEAGRLGLERHPTDVVQLVAAVVRGFETTAKDHGVTLLFQPPQNELWTDMDAHRAHQVIANVLSNALRHTPEGGQVTVELCPRPQAVEVLVSDSGPGIPEEALPYLFDRFYRADTGRSRAGGGSGLGLAIVKALTELQGGEVSAANRAEGGAMFRVSFPM